MNTSKFIAISLIVALGASFAVNAKAEEVVTQTTTKKTVVTSVKKPVKKAAVKTKTPSKKVVKAAPVKNLKATKTVLVKPESTPAPQPVPPPPANPEKVATNTLTVTPKTESPFSGGLTAEFYPENEIQKDSNALYVISGEYKFATRHKLVAIGRFTQTFISADAKEETKVTMLDPKFDYYYSFTEPGNKNFGLQLRFRNIPGWSEDSRTNGIRAFNSVRLEFVKPIGDFVFGLRPYVGHNWADYAVNAKGEPLSLFTVGHNLIMGYSFTKKFSWGIEIDTGFKMLQPEEVKAAAALAEVNGTPAPKTTETVKTALYIGTEVAYSFTKAFAARLGYAQEDGLVSDGKYALNMFGKETSRYYVGVDYSF